MKTRLRHAELVAHACVTMGVSSVWVVVSGRVAVILVQIIVIIIVVTLALADWT